MGLFLPRSKISLTCKLFIELRESCYEIVNFSCRKKALNVCFVVSMLRSDKLIKIVYCLLGLSFSISVCVIRRPWFA